LVWRNRKKISQIIKDYFYLPFFLFIILWADTSKAVGKAATTDTLSSNYVGDYMDETTAVRIYQQHKRQLEQLGMPTRAGMSKAVRTTAVALITL
jgi:hypothetical protein